MEMSSERLVNVLERLENAKKQKAAARERQHEAYVKDWQTTGYARSSDRLNYFAAKALALGWQAEIAYLNQLYIEEAGELLRSQGIDMPILSL